MTSHRPTGTRIVTAIFDVVGSDGQQVGLIRHVGMATKSGSRARNIVDVIEMCPPLHGNGQMQANAIGTARLSEDEWRRIQDFVDRHIIEHAAIQTVTREKLPTIYCILPHAKLHEEVDERYPRTRFSCAGFVFEAYRRARIILVDVTDLPPVDLQTIQNAYPDMASFLERAEVRDSLGLVGDGPWQVLLCGYLFHALNRNHSTIRNTPYTPVVADRVFV